MSKGRLCKHCVFWQRDEVDGVIDDEIEVAECHRHAPVTDPNDTEQLPIWPMTTEVMMCGDWEFVGNPALAAGER